MFKKIISGVLSLALCSSLALSIYSRDEENKTELTQKGSDYELSGSNSLGNYLTNLSDQKQNEDSKRSETSMFSVTALEFDAETKLVHVCSTQSRDCNVTVSIVDESSGKAAFSAVFPVKSGELIVTEEKLDVSALPEYYIVKAYLSDELGGKLSNEYTFNNYTKDMQEILRADIHDFNEEQVVNFDESEDTNFIVLNEDTVISESTEDENVLVTADYDNNVFTFENADENVRSMQFGQYFYIQPNDTDIIAVAVDSVETDGDITTVKGSDEPIDDMFDFIKIEQTERGSTMTVDTTEKSDEVTIIGHEDEDEFEIDGDSDIKLTTVKKKYDKLFESEFNTAHEIKIDLKDAALDVVNGKDRDDDEAEKTPGDDDEDEGPFESEIGIEGTLSLKFELNFYKKYSHINISFAITPSISLEASMGIKGEFPFSAEKSTSDLVKNIKEAHKKKAEDMFRKELKLLHISIATEIPGVMIQTDPKVVVEVSGAIKLSVTLSRTFGFIIDNKDENGSNLESIGDGSDSVFDKSLSFEGSISLKLIFDPKLVAINEDIVSIGIEAALGFEFGLEEENFLETNWLSLPSNSAQTVYKLVSDNDKEHGCNICATDEFDFVLSFGIKADIFTKKFELTVAEIKFPIFKGHISDHCTFKKGECEYYRYKASFNAKHYDTGADAGGVTINIDGVEVTTDQNGNAYVFCDNGSYSYTVYYQDQKIGNGSFKIKDAATTVDFKIRATIDKSDNFKYSISNKITNQGPIQTNVTTSYTTAAKKATTTTLAVAPEYKAIVKGKLGDNIGYSVYGDGTMFIYGYGDMDDKLTVNALQPSNTRNYRETVKEVIFEPYELYKADPDTGKNIAEPIAESDLKITSIGNSLFSGCKNLETIELPDSITRIGNNAFKDCKGLKTLNIPESLTILGNGAFYGCTNIQFGDLKLPDGITDIGSNVFFDCQGLTSLVIPDSVQNMGDHMAAFCCNLKKVTLPFVGHSRDTNDKQGILLDNLCYVISIYDNKDVLTQTYKDKLVTQSYRRLNGTIDVSAWIPTSLKSVIITGDESIPCNAFTKCSSLDEIILREGITTIEHNAFVDCHDMKIVIPESVITIDEKAFNNCTDIHIYGKKGSAAEKAANDNAKYNFLFTEIGGNNSTAATATTTAPDPTTVTTTTTAPASPADTEDILYGDANNNGIVDLSDAVMIMQCMSNPSKFGPTGSDPSHITEAGIRNADVYKRGDGLTLKDALAIQKFMLQLVEKLPES